jgi:CBS domain-containing protein
MRAPIALDEEKSEMGMVEAQMRMSDVRHVLIVDARGHLVGIVSRGDVLRALAAGGHQPVRDFMTRRLYTVQGEAPTVEAIDLLLTHGIGALPVVDDDGKPVGIICESDLLRVARQALA